MAKDSRADWGSVTEIERGKRYRLRWWANGPDGYKRHSETVRGTRRDAWDRLAALRLDHSTDAPVPTVGECWSRWYEPDLVRQVEAGDLSRRTLGEYRTTWGAQVSGAWADVPVDQVRPLAVQQWLSGLAHNAARVAVIVMRRTLAYAVRYEVIPANPMDVSYVMPSVSTSARADDFVWDSAGLCDCWRTTHGSFVEPAFLLSAFGSCRVGESLAARAEEVSRMDVGGIAVAVVPITRQVLSTGGMPTDRLKNPQSRRPVVLAGDPAERLLGLAGEVGRGWLANDGCGRPLSQKVARDEFARSLGAAGMDTHPYRNLRNSWETVARWTLRMPPWVTEKMMGHAGKDVTARHYDRPQVDEFASTLAEAWAQNPFADGIDFTA